MKKTLKTLGIFTFFVIIIFFFVGAGACDPDYDDDYTTTKKPDTPWNLKVKRSEYEPSTVEISWEYVSKADSYNIYSSSSPSYGTRIGQTTLSYYPSYGNSTNSTVYFKVTAVNDAGESIPTNWEKVDPVLLPAPTGVTITGVIVGTSPPGIRRLRISWDDVTGATRYNIYRSLTGIGSGNHLDSTYNSYYVLDDTKSTVYYRISALRGGVEGELTRWYEVKAAN
jgi:fibronectin type 3 domain-containing protein